VTHSEPFHPTAAMLAYQLVEFGLEDGPCTRGKPYGGQEGLCSLDCWRGATGFEVEMIDKGVGNAGLQRT
jgi:hypothetical protein